MSQQNSKWINNIDKVKTMHFISIVLISVYLVLSFYQTVQLDIKIEKGLIQAEQYERAVSDINRNLLGLVTIVILFFFKERSKNEEDK
ncbi:hypothetical protein H9I45_15180 [Polaribacter haliotis]|uniref:Uncharacterized protein n=1 Tax=Polaribacter haliotis TaxID=1888915 RepID=A0A7L8AFA0_9FLAO|nr:hypothetical protein [Polaribacter haliotis]QOD60662.1 hypothetical protein H9I45_15180 [Polaribacter haliotis]